MAPLAFVGVKAELLLLFAFELDVFILNACVEEPTLLLNRDGELNGKRSLPRNPEEGPLAFEEHEENKPPTTDGPTPVDPDKTLGAEVLRPSIGVGSAGFIKRSLARRF